MKILVLNSGSSSLKYQLIDMENEEVIAKGNYERWRDAFVKHSRGDNSDNVWAGCSTEVI